MDDTFSSVVTATSNNLTRLSTTMATAAQSLTTSSYGDLMNNATYQRTMRDIAKPLFHRRMFSFQTRRTPTEIVHRNFTSETTRFRVMTEIPDDILHDVPPGSTEFSLYQVFESELPAIAMNNAIQNPEDGIQACEIRKEAASSEIRGIDEQIELLKSMRQVVFDKVADLEQEERRLEKLADTSMADSIGSSGSTQNTSLSDAEVPETSKPTHERTRQRATSAQAFGERRASRGRRKTRATLQSFYRPGDQIRGIEIGYDPVACIDLDAPFGTLVYAAGSDVGAWDLGGGHFTQMQGHTDTVRCLQHLDDVLFASGSQDCTVRLWRVDKPAALCEYEGHVGPVTALHVDEDTMVSGSNDRTIRQWDLASGRCVQTLDVLSASQAPAPWKHGGARLLSSLLGALAVPPSDLVPAVGAVQNFDAALAAGTADGSVRLWDLRSGSVVRSLMGHMAPVSCLQFDDIHLVSGSLDGSIRIWDLRTGSVADTWSYDSPVLDLHFDAKSVFAATGEPFVRGTHRNGRKHFLVGDDAKFSTAGSVSVRQQSGYLVESRLDGKIGIWAV